MLYVYSVYCTKFAGKHEIQLFDHWSTELLLECAHLYIKAYSQRFTCFLMDMQPATGNHNSTIRRRRKKLFGLNFQLKFNSIFWWDFDLERLWTNVFFFSFSFITSSHENNNVVLLWKFRLNSFKRWIHASFTWITFEKRKKTSNIKHC